MAGYDIEDGAVKTCSKESREDVSSSDVLRNLSSAVHAVIAQARCLEKCHAARSRWKCRRELKRIRIYNQICIGSATPDYFKEPFLSFRYRISSRHYKAKESPLRRSSIHPALCRARSVAAPSSIPSRRRSSTLGAVFPEVSRASRVVSCA